MFKDGKCQAALDSRLSSCELIGLEFLAATLTEESRDSSTAMRQPRDSSTQKYFTYDAIQCPLAQILKAA